MHTALRASAALPIQEPTPGAYLPAAEPPGSPCSSCASRDAPWPLEAADGLDALVSARLQVRAGDALYRQGDKFESVYAVRSGTVKSTVALADGREQVSGFHMSGELLGLDGLASGAHATSACALEDTEICAIPYLDLAQVSSAAGPLHQALNRLMSREIVREHALMLLLGSMNAEERLAAFLLELSRRLRARGWSPSEFHLRMSRAEIGSYLGMKLETVSRTFSAFQQQGLLEVDKRHIRIIDHEGLARAFVQQVH